MGGQVWTLVGVLQRTVIRHNTWEYIMAGVDAGGHGVGRDWGDCYRVAVRCGCAVCGCMLSETRCPSTPDCVPEQLWHAHCSALHVLCMP